MNDKTAHDGVGDDPALEGAGPSPSNAAEIEASHSGDELIDALLRKAAHVPSRPQSSVLPRIGQVLGGKYRVEAFIGRGGMGAVYRASHVLTEKPVALKWMLRSAADPTAHRRFLREAFAAGRIDHPNVVDVYDVGEHGSCAYLVMELLHGEALQARLARGALAWREALDVLLPAMRGVSAAHRAGVIHRDLKPDNIFLCTGPDGASRDAKVLDFGIASVRSVGTLEPTLTGHGAVLGTPAYMSPEQLNGARDVDERADVYAFGVILYEALTGRRPFQAESYPGLVLAIAQQPPARPSSVRTDVPQALEEIVLRALAKARDDRFASIAALLDALVTFARTQPLDTDTHQTAPLLHSAQAEPRGYDPALSTTLSGASTARSAPAAARPLSIWGWAGAGLAALACAGVLSALWSSTSTTPEPPPAPPQTEQSVLPARTGSSKLLAPSYAAPAVLDLPAVPVPAYAAATSPVTKSAAGALPRSCEEARRAGYTADTSLRIDPDGPGAGKAFEIYCAGMSAQTGSDPEREYISLLHGARSNELDRNVTRFVYEGGACPCPTLSLHFSRVRLNLRTLSIDPTDLTFATYDRPLSCELQHKSQCGESPKLSWGGPGSCRALGDTSGSASIDLRGTPFSLAKEMRFVPAGFGATGSAVISNDRKHAELIGGGRCGSLVAEQGSVAVVAEP